jgi:hypothetical protein
VGEPTDGDEVNAGLGNLPRGLGRDAARGLANGAVTDHRDAAIEIIERHVVEQHGVDADAERFFELGECIDLDFDLDKVADVSAGATDADCDSSRSSRRTTAMT